MARYGFGVDVGGTTCKLGLFTEDGALLEKWEIPTNTENGGVSILEDIACSVERTIARKGIDRNDVFGLGIGVPGAVLADGTVNKCVNLGWGVVNIEQEMGKRLGFITRVGNDANVAALGEMWQGGGKGCQNVVMVTLGTGVGGGIVIDGRILTGAHGAGGEIGHIKVRDHENKRCGCGKTGCLEQYASAPGIVRLARERLAADDTASVLRTCRELTAKDVADAAREGDKLAAEVISEVARLLGIALASISCTTDPEVIVIGGGVSRAGSILLDPVRECFRAQAFHACEDTKFALATLGNDAGIYGCVKLLLG